MGSEEHPPNCEYRPKKSKRINAFLAIEIATAECFFEAHTTMRSDSVALCLQHTAQDLQQNGFEKVIFFLDQNTAHKNMMRYNLALLPRLNIRIEFRYFPPYSPKLNIVEFLIHRIRQKKLHHAPHSRNLPEITADLKEYLNHKKTFSIESIHNTLDHIRRNANFVNLSQ